MQPAHRFRIPLFVSAILLLSLTRIFQSFVFPEKTGFLKLLISTPFNTVLPGYELDPLRAYLPKTGTVSLITDKAYEEGYAVKEVFFIIQNRIAPLLLNPQPVEAAALVFCTNHDKAVSRLSSLGYRMAVDLQDGRGLAVKVPS